MDPKQILDLPMGENDADAETIRDYLKELLFAVWEKGEGFSGKHPFGNSGWEYELYHALIAGKTVEATLDEYGDIQDFPKAEQQKANKLIFEAIESLQ